MPQSVYSASGERGTPLIPKTPKASHHAVMKAGQKIFRRLNFHPACLAAFQAVPAPQIWWIKAPLTTMPLHPPGPHVHTLGQSPLATTTSGGHNGPSCEGVALADGKLSADRWA